MFRKMINKNTRTVSFISWVSWMGVIFAFSQLPGNVSDGQSHMVIYLFSLLGLSLNSFFGDLANFIIRKLSHFSEYFILFILTLNLFKIYFYKLKSWNLSLIFVFIYACTDEFHQIFIPGRTATFRDVIIDTLGGILAYIITAIICKRYNGSPEYSQDV